MARLHAARDPFWDMDGNGVRRTRRRTLIVGITAFILAVAAAALAFAAWIRELAPVLGTLGLG
jgi:CHASE2 domain-containing sensor protein